MNTEKLYNDEHHFTPPISITIIGINRIQHNLEFRSGVDNFSLKSSGIPFTLFDKK